MILISLVLTAVVLAWFFIRRVYSYWERKGFPYVEPTIPFGNLDSVRKREKNFGMAIYDLYLQAKEPFIGIYLLFRPALLIRDADLAKDILAKDFASFHDRGTYVDEVNDPISGNLFALEGQKWRSLRTKLTPSFTSGKLKNMFGTVEETGIKMQNHLEKIVPAGGSTVVEVKDLMSRYAVDIIGSVIFGLEVNSFEDPDNKFHRMGRKINDSDFLTTLQGLANFLCPSVAKILRRLKLQTEVDDFMIEVVRKTIEYREKNNVSRKDLMQLLIQLRNTGKINVDDTIWNVESAAENLKSMSIEQIAGQAFLFYVAGFETSAATTAYCLYELAQNPEILARVEKEIEETLAKHDGKITYDSIQDMKYLELCIMETVRKYPGLPILNRQCTKDYQIPGTDKVIEKGTAVVISLMGLHRDEKYFPNAMQFDPERFVEGAKNYNPAAYMPFGEGPRHCIAFRMGKVNAKVGIVMLLSKYKVECIEKRELEIDNYAVVIMPKGGINLNISRR